MSLMLLFEQYMKREGDSMGDQPVMEQVEPTQHVEKRAEKPAKLAWILVVVLFISNIAGFGLYGFAQRQLQSAQAGVTLAEKKTAETEKLLRSANDRLARATFLPKGSEVSPQCSTGNNDYTRFAPVNTTPIAGYNLYIVNCLQDLTTGKTSTRKLVAFQANVDGSQKFVYGAGSDEPYCIPNTLLKNAATISQQTGLPLCKKI